MWIAVRILIKSTIYQITIITDNSKFWSKPSFVFPVYIDFIDKQYNLLQSIYHDALTQVVSKSVKIPERASFKAIQTNLFALVTYFY